MTPANPSLCATAALRNIFRDSTVKSDIPAKNADDLPHVLELSVKAQHMHSSHLLCSRDLVCDWKVI